MRFNFANLILGSGKAISKSFLSTVDEVDEEENLESDGEEEDLDEYVEEDGNDEEPEERPPSPQKPPQKKTKHNDK